MIWNEVSELIENQQIKKSTFASKMGISRTTLDSWLDGRTAPNINDLNKMSSLMDKLRSELVEEKSKKGNKKQIKRIPFYDVKAEGGSGYDVSPISQSAGTIEVGDLLKDSEAAMRISGNSMIPNYPPGCVVGLIKRYNSFIEPGEVYVIETRDGRILKRLFYKDDNTSGHLLTCYSDNIMTFQGGARDGRMAYPPFDLPREEILNLYTVVGVIKRNTNSLIVHKTKKD